MLDLATVGLLSNSNRDTAYAGDPFAPARPEDQRTYDLAEMSLSVVTGQPRSLTRAVDTVRDLLHAAKVEGLQRFLKSQRSNGIAAVEAQLTPDALAIPAPVKLGDFARTVRPTRHDMVPSEDRDLARLGLVATDGSSAGPRRHF